jgi:MFS family permease
MSLALFSVPRASFATVGGGLIDRYGVQRSMLLALAICALASIAA